MATAKLWWKFDLSLTNYDTFHEQILKLRQLCYQPEKLISSWWKKLKTLFRNFIQSTFYFLFLLPMTGIFQADNNLTISNFEEVLAASCELKDIRFQMMARRSNSYCYCFSSMCKCIKLSCIQHYLLIFASYLIFKINPNYNILPIWKYCGLYLWQGKNNKFPKPFCKQWPKWKAWQQLNITKNRGRWKYSNTLRMRTVLKLT